MREILFRGKRKDNGEWVYGYYVKAEKLDKSDYEYFIIEEPADGEEHLVIPETVGQYIGWTDKNAKKLFEGDIFTYDSETTYLVEWDCEYCGFYTEAVGGYNDYDYLGDFYSNLCKVIGNIHDNPELLEVDNGKID